VSKVEVDPRGWPDYTYPMTIIGQELNVAIDIAAQSLPTLDVNIAASAVTMDVNIASSAVTLNINIESISEGVVFNVAQSGAWTINAVQTGTWTINIGAPLDASGYLQTHIMDSVQLDVNIAASAVTLNVAIQSSAVTLNVKITGSTVTLNVNITGSTVTLNVKITSSDAILSVYIIGQSASLDIRITDSTVTLNVNIESIASGVVFNVAQSGTWTINAVQSGSWSINIESVSAGVTFNVNITGQTANINIDIKAQSVAIKGLTDWAAENATDIDVVGWADCSSGVETRIVSYTVPSGKKLLIYNWDAMLRDGDGQVSAMIYNATTLVGLGFCGGTRGFSVTLNKPIRVSSGQTVEIYARQNTGASREIFAHIGGVLL